MEMIDCGPDNLLYRWKGSDTEALPALLLAHQDVVPASDATQWRFPPFASTVAEGYVWGRGSFDAKGQLIAICESAEALLAQGFTPRRTWYIAFGCDEETRGTEGAARISAHLERQGIRFAFVLDEGGVVADRFIAGIDRPIAVVGIAEKGDAHIRLTCTKGGGHSSTPDNPAAPAILGRAMWRLESKRPRPRMTRPVRLMLHTLGRHVPFPIAFLFLNLWLTKPLVQYAFSRNPTLGALVRSTCTVTMAQGSEAPNVVPTMASAVANIRLLPDEGAEDMLGWMRKRIGDNRIVLTIEHNSRRSKPSRIDGPEFGLLSGTITRVFPDAITVPYLMTGGTDALWYEPLSDCVFRFTPVRMDNGELKRMHGTDERLSLENLEKAMRFYMALLHEDQ
jgi:carboxypeptidase PM20D1